LIAAALLASLAGTGHAQVEEGLPGAVHMTSDGIHLLASGSWLGGLLPLGFLLARARDTKEPGDVAAASTALSRFSGMGSLTVALLVATGLVNSFFLVGTLSNLTGTPYGRLLVLKLAIFGAMLTLAALNRFWLVPKLTGGRTASSIGVLKRLSGNVLGEQILGLAVIAIVSLLGMMEPAINPSDLSSQ
jgi:putative copper resistance protein D